MILHFLSVVSIELREPHFVFRISSNVVWWFYWQRTRHVSFPLDLFRLEGPALALRQAWDANSQPCGLSNRTVNTQGCKDFFHLCKMAQ